MVAVEAELLADAHESLVGKERADLLGVLVGSTLHALRADDDAPRGELLVVSDGRGGEARAGPVVVENGAVRIAVGVVRRPTEEPEALPCVHFEEHTVYGLVQEAATVREMDESVLWRHVHVVDEADRGGNGGALLTTRVVRVEHTAHVQAELVRQPCGDAVVVAQRGCTQPLRLLGVDELLTGDGARVLPEAVELLVGVRKGPRDDDEELVLDAVFRVWSHERVVETDLAGQLLGPLALVARVVGSVVQLVGVLTYVVGLVGNALERRHCGGVETEVLDDSVKLLLMLVLGAQDAQHVLVEAVGHFGLHLVHDNAIEDVAGHRQHAGRLGRRAREVIPRELHVLVHVVVWQEGEGRVLRHLQGGVARPALLFGERKRRVCGTASRVHAVMDALVNKTWCVYEIHMDTLVG